MKAIIATNRQEIAASQNLELECLQKRNSFLNDSLQETLEKLQEKDQELEMAEKLGIHQEKVILNLESDCLKTWNDLLSMEEELERANQAAKNLEKRYSDLGKSKKVVIKMLKRNSKKLKKAERLGRKFRIKLVQAESKLKATVQQSSELLQQVSHGMSDRLNVVG